MTRKPTLRLLYTTKCNRSCHYCVNKQWDLNEVPDVIRFSHYGEIIITGGEPLLKPREVIGAIKVIRALTDAKIYVYTAVADIVAFDMILRHVDGITLSLHDKFDVLKFKSLNHWLIVSKKHRDKVLRLNVMKAPVLEDIRFAGYNLWTVKEQIVPLDECPLPENEVFMKLKGVV